MATQEQAEQIADSVSEEPRKELESKRSQREAITSTERRRRESPLIPALIASMTVIVALEYLENTMACVLLGTVVGSLFGRAARRN